MSETLAMLRNDLTTLRADLKEAAKREKDFEKRERDFEAQVKALTTERDNASGRVTELEAKVGKPSVEAQARIDELTTENRGYKHKAVFRDKAVAEGLDPRYLETAYRESGYKADSDDPADDAIAAAIAKAKESHPVLFGAGGATGTVPATPPARPPLGSDRGTAPGSAMFRVKESQVADPTWKLANQAAFLKAGKEGTLQIVPG